MICDIIMINDIYKGRRYYNVDSMNVFMRMLSYCDSSQLY